MNDPIQKILDFNETEGVQLPLIEEEELTNRAVGKIYATVDTLKSSTSQTKISTQQMISNAL